MKAVRWGDDDRYLGPFTWSNDSWTKWSVILSSRGDDDVEVGQCHLRLSAGKYTLIVALPEIVKPHMEKVYPESWKPDDVERMGRDWYWKIDRCEYGFSVSDGFLQIKRGRSTHDSATDRSFGYFLPWTQWRHVRRSLYDLEGRHFWSEIDAETEGINKLGGKMWRERWDIMRQWEERCPKASFRFEDFDNEGLIATTMIEEREWLRGTGWCSWMSWFWPKKVRRSLNISFNDETGPEKGSWKGGVMGTGIDMFPGELHEAAFRRYCDEEHRAKGRKYKVKFREAI